MKLVIEVDQVYKGVQVPLEYEVALTYADPDWKRGIASIQGVIKEVLDAPAPSTRIYGDPILYKDMEANLPPDHLVGVVEPVPDCALCGQPDEGNMPIQDYTGEVHLPVGAVTIPLTREEPVSDNYTGAFRELQLIAYPAEGALRLFWHINEGNEVRKEPLSLSHLDYHRTAILSGWRRVWSLGMDVFDNARLFKDAEDFLQGKVSQEVFEACWKPARF